MQVLLSKFLPAAYALLNSLIYYALIIFGGVLFSYGWWLVYKPVGYMVLAVLIVLAVVDSRR
jgi:hypothetical protein